VDLPGGNPPGHNSPIWRVDITAALAHFRKEEGLREDVLRILPAFIPSEENLQADAASRFQLVPDWHLNGNVFRQISTLWEHPRSTSSRRTSWRKRRALSWRAADSPEAIDALSMGGNFHLAFLFPFIPLHKRIVRKLEVSRGIYLLVTPYWEAQVWFTSFQLLPVLVVRRLPFHDALVVDLATGEPPPSLERFFLVVWRICGGLGESTPSQTGLSGLSRQDGSRPQRTGSKGLGNPSSLFCVLPPFLSIRCL
jgi:hypothetical protein